MPREEGSAYSGFPSNTNILFADIATIRQAIQKCPIPGMIVNLKKIHPYEEKEVARLESTMQNIADHLVDTCIRSPTQHVLKTYLTYNLRRKTISTAKKEYIAGGPLLETPEGCFYDLLHNAYDLLEQDCHFKMPQLRPPQEYLLHGPSFLFLYHPALGPLYSIIGQKLRRGEMTLHSEMQLEIAELDVEGLIVKGSFVIKAEQVMGHRVNGLLQYSEQTGKCRLKHVTIDNKGIDRNATQCYWKNEIVRTELCEIVLHGNGEFVAEGVTLKGNMRIVVEDGYRVTALEKEGNLMLVKEKLHSPSWSWRYQFESSRIVLSN